jgi:2,4-dienoyl-CoA reductase-like NADH-dependent reductase (Old Yellow Enzyme family)
LFEAAAAALDDIGVAFLEMREPRPGGSRGEPDQPPIHPAMRKVYRGVLALNSDYDAASAQAALDAGEADAIAFGRLAISNPDLPERFAENAELAPWDDTTFYGDCARGYNDYPRVAAAR